MSDRTYDWARVCCYPVFWVSTRWVILHRERAAIPGAYILAPTHLSHFDAPLLIGHTTRRIDFVALADLGRRLWARFLFYFYNVIYLDRRRGRAVRIARQRLRQGRVVGWFPEGGVRSFDKSVLNGGPMYPGLARLAAITRVPVIPCVVLGAEALLKVRNWLPLRAVRHGVIYGNPIRVDPKLAPSEGRDRFLRELRQSYVELHRELAEKMKTATPKDWI